MNIQDMPSATRTGWILVACVAGFVLAFASLVVYLGHKNQQREEILAHQLIADFHDKFNSAAGRKLNTSSFESPPEIQEVYACNKA
jgi:hypothetical protein